MSDYFEPVKKLLKGKAPISRGSEMDFYMYNEKTQASLFISPFKVTYKGYTVPLNESQLEDLYNMASMVYSIQEEKNKKAALEELEGEEENE
jgi:hypothetical protein